MLSIRNILFLIVLSFIFFFSSLIIPFAGIIILPFSSISIIALLIKYGIFAGLAGIVLSSIVIYKLTSFGYILLSFFLLLVAMNSIILSFGILKKINAWKIIFESCLLTNLFLIIGLLAINLSGFQLTWALESVISGLPKDLSNTVLTILTKNIYAISTIFITTNIFLSYIFLSLISKKYEIPINKLPPFEKWKLPEQTIFFLIFSMLFYGISIKMKYNIPSQIFENILYVIFFLYFMQGLSISKYFLNKQSFLLIIIYILFVFYPPLSIFLGIVDIWLNFRTKGDSKNEDYLKKGS